MSKSFRSVRGEYTADRMMANRLASSSRGLGYLAAVDRKAALIRETKRAMIESENKARSSNQGETK